MPAGRDGRRWRETVAIARREFPPVCYLCGLLIDMTLHHNDPMSWTIEHKQSLAEGGDPYDLANLAPAHRRCNSIKGAHNRPVTPPKTSRKWK
ncbi:HNH endonuclease [Streptomyces microflavus]|uniref:HNH endonuclease n=1 Tax=Streptomyces microflavus TaxID=1919 RepID=UPI0036B95611